MPDKKKILAISGSTRAHSTNLNYITAIAALAESRFAVAVFEGLTDIPHFNPDLDNENPPAPVSDLRRALREADGVLICTPEYAMGVPGTLKNAIDWTVSSCEFSHKPVALVTASSSGLKGHAALLETLRVIEAEMTDDTALVISYAKTKITEDGQIKHEETLDKIHRLIEGLDRLIPAGT
jgi:NAD(P)H-dependent FMN reductase